MNTITPLLRWLDSHRRQRTMRVFHWFKLNDYSCFVLVQDGLLINSWHCGGQCEQTMNPSRQRDAGVHAWFFFETFKLMQVQIDDWQQHHHSRNSSSECPEYCSCLMSDPCSQIVTESGTIRWNGLGVVWVCVTSLQEPSNTIVIQSCSPRNSSSNNSNIALETCQQQGSGGVLISWLCINFEPGSKAAKPGGNTTLRPTYHVMKNRGGDCREDILSYRLHVHGGNKSIGMHTWPACTIGRDFNTRYSS